jgi:thioredoxin reductase
MYNVIVIGSGMGGLTAAGLLAGVADCKALLESRGALHVFIEGY